MTKLVDVLSNPDSLRSIPTIELSEIVAEARYHNMLPQIKSLCESADVWRSLHSQVKMHVEAALVTYHHQKLHLDYEVRDFTALFASMNVKYVYLKGAAYQLSEFEEFHGRLMSDIDLLVSENELTKVEKLLNKNGWLHSHIGDYDDKFYREWSQEIPPMRHIERQTILDLHFNILPKTLKAAPPSDVLLQNTQTVGNHKVQVLNPPAMVIHSAIHLFYESEYHKGIRDLYDLFLLFTRFGKEEKFWFDLIELQKQIGNGDCVYYALRYCALLLGLNVPKSVLAFYDTFRPNPIKLVVADFSFIRVFSEGYPPNRRFGHSIAEKILYFRGHWKRMPLKLLIPHMVKKSLIKMSSKDDEELVF